VALLPEYNSVVKLMDLVDVTASISDGTLPFETFSSPLYSESITSKPFAVSTAKKLSRFKQDHNNMNV
jgi:hypothetical protein